MAANYAYSTDEKPAARIATSLAGLNSTIGQPPQPGHLAESDRAEGPPSRLRGSRNTVPSSSHRTTSWPQEGQAVNARQEPCSQTGHSRVIVHTGSRTFTTSLRVCLTLMRLSGSPTQLRIDPHGWFRESSSSIKRVVCQKYLAPFDSFKVFNRATSALASSRERTTAFTVILFSIGDFWS